MPPVNYHYGAFPPEFSGDAFRRFVRCIGPASAALARFEGVLGVMPNAFVLLSPLTTQEAVLSSKIEGTITTLGEVLEYEAGAKRAQQRPGKVDDIQEVLQYRRAMTEALNLMRELPLCLRVVKEAHRVLLDGVRGRSKAPGEFRKTQNFIAPPGAKLEEARFVPVSADKLLAGMDAWEKFIHAEDYIDPLIQLALIHVEFEALHPFHDGNGRMGRMLVPLFLHWKGILSQPVFYISAYLERNREEYYERLLAVSRDHDWVGWCEFFLAAITAQANENREKAESIQALYKEMLTRVQELTHSRYHTAVVNFMFQAPMFRTPDLVRGSGVPKPTAQRIVQLLKDNAILIEVEPARGARPATLAFRELLNRAEGRDVF
jgi:Fic family protein